VHAVGAVSVAIFLVEQHAKIAPEFAKRLMALDRGPVVCETLDGTTLPESRRIDKLIRIEVIS
jgi:ABC-type branched-subunit amino acid transport system ATPase component